MQVLRWVSDFLNSNLFDSQGLSSVYRRSVRNGRVEGMDSHTLIASSSRLHGNFVPSRIGTGKFVPCLQGRSSFWSSLRGRSLRVNTESGGFTQLRICSDEVISRVPHCMVRAATSATVSQGGEHAQKEQERVQEVEKAKMQLLQAVLDTKRGASATADQRAAIEEAMVGVEKFDAGTAISLDQLNGTWLLQYTTAPDVISLLQAAELPFLQVGQVYQKFDCLGRTDGGTVENIVRWSIPGLLQENEGATLIVTAKFSVASSRSIVLQFKEQLSKFCGVATFLTGPLSVFLAPLAGTDDNLSLASMMMSMARVGEVEISAEFETFLAPAILPRTFINLQVLQFLRSLDVRVPLLRPQSRQEDARRAPIGLRYYLTYLDKYMLLGRALGSGGVFVFSRTQSRRQPS